MLKKTSSISTGNRAKDHEKKKNIMKLPGLLI